MRLNDLFEEDIFGDSMLSGSNDCPYDIEVNHDEKGGVTYLATVAATGETVGKWKVKDCIITNRATSEEHKYNKVFDAMCRFICKLADESNVTLMVDSKTFEKRSLGRKFAAFGFVPNSDIASPSMKWFMERRPGAGLALVTPK